jgi:TonB family protein
MHKCLILSLLSCLSLLTSFEARADDRANIESILQKTYEHQLMSLRTPHGGNKLEFDPAGKFVGSGNECPWSTCGMLQVEKISLNPERLEITGKRVIIALRSNNRDLKIAPLVTERKLRIRLAISDAPLTSAAVDEAVAKVFDPDRLQDRVVAYWKPKLNFGARNFDDQSKQFKQNTKDGIIGELEGGRPVYIFHAGAGTPPRAIHAPNPEYTDNATQKRLAGIVILKIVVNEKGFPEILEVTQGLGEGLDIEAIAAVATWTFKPATRNGLPVATLVTVQAEFRFH